MGRLIAPLIFCIMDINPISSGLGALGSVVTTGANMYEAKKQREWNESMLDKQNNFSLDMWNRTNEYNTPLAQVQRLQEAGLNPLYFGLDGSSASSFESASPLGYERPQFDSSANPITVGLSSALAEAQISNVQADTAKKSEETLSEVKRREKMSQEIENLKQENNNLLSQEGLNDAQRKQIEKNIEWLDRLNEANVAKIESETKLNQSQKHRIDELLEGEKILQSKSAEDFDYKWKKIRAEINKMSKETGLLAKDIENYALNHASNGFMGTGLSLQNLFRLLSGGKGNSNNGNYNPDSDIETLIREGQ